MTDWMPIETAPAKTWILTFGAWQYPPVGVSRYEDLTRIVERVERETTHANLRRRIIQEEEVKEREWEGHHWEPTHWMPLPEPPGDTDAEQTDAARAALAQAIEVCQCTEPEEAIRDLLTTLEK